MVTMMLMHSSTNTLMLVCATCKTHEVPASVAKIVEPFGQVGRPSDEVIEVLHKAFSELNIRI
jgi:hypothetical protein